MSALGWHRRGAGFYRAVTGRAVYTIAQQDFSGIWTVTRNRQYVGFGHTLHLYSAESVLRTLRAGDSIAFYWYPDAGTNQNARDAGLHVDYLYLDVTRGARVTRHLAAVSVCPDNSARMCK